MTFGERNGLGIRVLVSGVLVGMLVAIGGCESRSASPGSQETGEQREGGGDSLTTDGEVEGAAPDTAQGAAEARRDADPPDELDASEREATGEVGGTGGPLWPFEIFRREPADGAGDHEVGRLELAHLGLPEDFEPRELFGELRRGERAEVEYSAERMPEEFRDLQALDVLTPEGIERVAIEKIVTTTYGPWYRRFFYLQTVPTDLLERRVPHHQPGDFSGRWTFAAPAGELPDSASYRLPEVSVPNVSREKLLDLLLSPHEWNTEEGDVLRRLRELRDRSPDAGGRWRLGDDETFEREVFRTLRGRFLPPHDRLLFGADIDIDHAGPQPVSAVFLLGEQGGVTAPIHPPAFEAQSSDMRPIAVADPDGDGVEGLLYEYSRRFHDRIHWLTFEHGRPEVRTVYELDRGHSGASPRSDSLQRDAARGSRRRDRPSGAGGGDAGSESEESGRGGAKRDEGRRPVWPAKVERDGRVRIDLGRFDWPEWFEKGRLFGPLAEGEPAEAVYRPEAMPPGFRDLHAVDVVTGDGPIRLGLERFVTGALGHDYDRYSEVETEAAEQLNGGSYNWTFAVPAGRAPTPSGAGRTTHARAPKIVRSTLLEALLAPHEGESTDSKVLEKLRTIPDGSPDAGDRWEFSDGSFDADDFQATDGNFSAPHAGLVYVSSTADFGIITNAHRARYPPAHAMFLVDEHGDVTATLHGSEFEHNIPRVAITEMADPDGDGVEEVLYALHSLHGHSVYRLDFEGSEPVVDLVFREVVE